MDSDRVKAIKERIRDKERENMKGESRSLNAFFRAQSFFPQVGFERPHVPHKRQRPTFRMPRGPLQHEFDATQRVNWAHPVEDHESKPFMDDPSFVRWAYDDWEQGTPHHHQAVNGVVQEGPSAGMAEAGRLSMVEGDSFHFPIMPNVQGEDGRVANLFLV
jgi:hypothetical protein